MAFLPARRRIFVPDPFGLLSHLALPHCFHKPGALMVRWPYTPLKNTPLVQPGSSFKSSWSASESHESSLLNGAALSTFQAGQALILSLKRRWWGCGGECRGEPRHRQRFLRTTSLAVASLIVIGSLHLRMPPNPPYKREKHRQPPLTHCTFCISVSAPALQDGGKSPDWVVRV